MKKIEAFTIVELIMVIILITVISWISFLSYKDSVKDARDSVRKNDLEKLQKSLINFQAVKWYYPEPDSFSISTTKPWWLEWYFWTWVKEKIWNIDLLRDPSTNSPYKYMINSWATNFELVTNLENEKKFKLWDYSKKTDKFLFEN